MEDNWLFAIILIIVIFLLFYDEPSSPEPSEPSDTNIFVARVIFSEASPMCSDNERLLVASAIKNRIRHPGFDGGNLLSMYDVVTQKRAFSCINDINNSNWMSSKHFEQFAGEEKRVWKQCLALAIIDFKAVRHRRPFVYFHDKSIAKPKSWDNRWWTAHKEFESKHFIFYSITENK